MYVHKNITKMSFSFTILCLHPRLYSDPQFDHHKKLHNTMAKHGLTIYCLAWKSYHQRSFKLDIIREAKRKRQEPYSR